MVLTITLDDIVFFHIYDGIDKCYYTSEGFKIIFDSKHIVPEALHPYRVRYKPHWVLIPPLDNIWISII